MNDSTRFLLGISMWNAKLFLVESPVLAKSKLELDWLMKTLLSGEEHVYLHTAP
jgi:hypothetical protein